MRMAGERYVLDENSIKKAYGFISITHTFLEEWENNLMWKYKIKQVEPVARHKIRPDE